MEMKRFYIITVAELIVLHEVLAEYGRELGCDQCGDDLCQHCQRNYVLCQKLIDARNLAEVGVHIVLTTDSEMIQPSMHSLKLVQKPN